MNLQGLCERTVADVDGCLGCAVVDLDTGLPLGVEVARGSILGQEAMEVMAAASVEYFRGNMIWQLELAMTGGQSIGGFVREIQATTAHTSIIMSMAPGREGNVLLLIMDKAANLGLGRIAMRQALAHIAGEGESQQAPAAVGGAPVAGGANVVMPSAFASDRMGNASPPRVAYRDDAAVGGSEQHEAAQSVDSAGRQWRGGHGRR